MDMQAVLLAGALVAGLVALEVRRASICVAAIALAVGLSAVALGVAGALEVAVGTALAAVVIALLFRWAFRRAGGDDTVSRMPQGAPAVLGALTVIAFTVVAFLVLGETASTGAVATAGEEGAAGAGLLREAAVIAAAAAGVWAMMRGTGRRDE